MGRHLSLGWVRVDAGRFEDQCRDSACRLAGVAVRVVHSSAVLLRPQELHNEITQVPETLRDVVRA
jgi:hypothetical protein